MPPTSATGRPNVILQRLRDTVKLKGLKTRDEVRLALRDEIERMLLPAQKPLNLEAAKPPCHHDGGRQRRGQDHHHRQNRQVACGPRQEVLLAAADTFRAAAREQLAVWGERNKIEVIAQNGGDPAAVVFDAVSAGIARGMDVVIADTAGRLPTQANLMEELGRIRRSQAKAMAGAPHEVILVVDGTNGPKRPRAGQGPLMRTQRSRALSSRSSTATAKGGVLLAITAERGEKPLPIYFVGVGEQIDDLQPFDAHAFASALVGLES